MALKINSSKKILLKTILMIKEH